MANEIATAGIQVLYAVEATAGTRPTTGYTAIPNIKGISGIAAEPATYEVTDLSDTEYKRYIPALKDMGGNITLNVNLTEAFKTAWGTLVAAYETAIAADKATWFEFKIPGWTDSFYIAGIPTELSFPDVDTDAVLDGNVYVAPNQIEGWATASA